jgi:tetratricopeptide (TPR) repeat protein
MTEGGAARRPGPGRRAALVLVVGLLGVLTSAFFLRMFVAAKEELAGRRAFLDNNTVGALRHYEACLRWGGPVRPTQLREAEALLLRLDQIDLGVKGAVPESAEEMSRRTGDLIAALLRDAPRRAYFWSLYAGVAQRAGREARKRSVLDLSRISENPLENLGPDDWTAIGALRVAASIEPNNVLYQDLLVDAFLDAGAQEAALPYVRGALRCLPVYAAHQFLDRSPIPEALLDAAMQGYDDALREGSLVGTTQVRCDAAEFLLRSGQAARALPYIEAALQASPRAPLTRYLMGQVKFQLADYRAAVPHLEAAARGYADSAAPQYFLGRAHEELGEMEQAVEAYRAMRQLEPQELRAFYALGAALEKLGRLDEAERQYVAATNYHPSEPAAWVALIEYRRRHDDRIGERQACDQLLALKPDDRGYVQLCGRAAGDPS